jgi:FemAB family protein
MKIVRADMPSFPALWALLRSADEFQHSLYSGLGSAYYQAYFHDSRFQDVSFLIEENGEPLLGVGAALRILPDGRHELSASGMPIICIESPHLAQLQGRHLSRLLAEEMDRLLDTYPICSILSQNLTTHLSPLGSFLLERGATSVPHFTQVIDLSLPPDVLHRSIRRSYKSLINWGEKNLCLRMVSASNAASESIDSFRCLHVEVAGRETRPLRTWELQWQMIREGEAFLILGEWNEKLVTAALFQHSSRFCYYSVGVSRRELFDKPLSHVVLWRAILHAQRLGCRFFEVGQQLFPSENGTPSSEKERNISDFKRGFGGETFIRLNLLWQRQSA